jgi:hypothetical protein
VTRLLFASVTVAALAGLAPSAPVPKTADKPPPYFPTKAGARWVYERDDHDGRGPSEDVRVVTRVARDGDTLIASVGLVNADGAVGGEYERVFVSPGGLSRTYRPGKAADPILRLPHRPGQKWGSRGGNLSGTHHACAPEDVAVPAGAYRALRVDLAEVAGADAISWSWWYAAHIGPVKWTYKDRHRDIVMAFKSFTPGED